MYVDNSVYINLTTNKYYLECGPPLGGGDILIKNDLGEEQYYYPDRFVVVKRKDCPLAWYLFS
jgi:hypothetical protein